MCVQVCNMKVQVLSIQTICKPHSDLSNQPALIHEGYACRLQMRLVHGIE